ncbi:hypothetical protein [Bacillus sp. Marseille-Q3570]|uniref:hypothetical protein n=1 Tax=Bacillus sp. Marseille-Q3570 TaxID=2963522 RepID=UPI0021B7DC52|nr:hypothetical protein [Bacillus sp. Marseille-Q3570]
MVTVFWIAPQLTGVYSERVSIKQEEFAIEKCHTLLQEWKLKKSEPKESVVEINGIEYSVTSNKLSSDHIEICLDWTGANGREKSICGQA